MPWIKIRTQSLSVISAGQVAEAIGIPPARFYLTGDGHGRPPFTWAQNHAFAGYFIGLADEGNLCLHVEQLQEQITVNSIPAAFVKVFTSKKVLGWELDIYRSFEPILNLIADMIRDDRQQKLHNVTALHDGMMKMLSHTHTVEKGNWMIDACNTSNKYLFYWRGLLTGPQPRPVRDKMLEDEYIVFLQGYLMAAMELRTGAHKSIGAKITQGINAYPNDTHLIAVGDAHITADPLYVNIQIGPHSGIYDTLKDT